MNKYTFLLLAALAIISVQAAEQIQALEDTDQKREHKIKSLIKAHNNNQLRFYYYDSEDLSRLSPNARLVSGIVYPPMESNSIFAASAELYMDKLQECVELLHELGLQGKLKDPNKDIITATGGKEGWDLVIYKDNKMFWKYRNEHE